MGIGYKTSPSSRNVICLLNCSLYKTESNYEEGNHLLFSSPLDNIHLFTGLLYIPISFSSLFAISMEQRK